MKDLRLSHGPEGRMGDGTGCSCKTEPHRTRPKRLRTWSATTCRSSSKSTSAHNETTASGHRIRPIWTSWTTAYGASWRPRHAQSPTSQSTHWKRVWRRPGTTYLKMLSTVRWMTSPSVWRSVSRPMAAISRIISYIMFCYCFLFGIK